METIYFQPLCFNRFVCFVKLTCGFPFAGGIKFALDVGSERFEVNTPNHGIDYTNGQQHEVRMWRTGVNGQMVHLQVRERERERERERKRERERESIIGQMVHLQKERKRISNCDFSLFFILFLRIEKRVKQCQQLNVCFYL